MSDKNTNCGCGGNADPRDARGTGPRDIRGTVRDEYGKIARQGNGWYEVFCPIGELPPGFWRLVDEAESPGGRHRYRLTSRAKMLEALSQF